MQAPRQPFSGPNGLLAGALALLIAVGGLGADRTAAEAWLVEAQATSTSTPTSMPDEPPRVFGTVASPTATPPFRGEPPRGFAPIPTRTPTPPPVPTAPPAPPVPFEPPSTAIAPDTAPPPSSAPATVALPGPAPAATSPESPPAPVPIATLQIPQLPEASPTAPTADAAMEPAAAPAAATPDQPLFIAIEPSAVTPVSTLAAIAAVPEPEPIPTVAPVPTVPPAPTAPPAAPTPAAAPTATPAPQTSPTVSAASVLATLRRRLERNPTPEVPSSQQCLSPSDVAPTNRDGSPVTALQTLASAPNELTLGCANTTSGVALGWSPLSSAPLPVTYTVFRCPLQARPESGNCRPLLSATRPELVGPLDAGFDYYVEALDARGATWLSNRLTLRR